MEEEVKILKVACQPVRIIRGHVWQNVQPQVATIADPSMEEFSSDSEVSVKEVFVKQPKELHQNIEVVRSVLTARDRWTTLINSDKWNTNKAGDMKEEAVLLNERLGRKLC